MITILASIGTNEVKTRFEKAAQAGGFVVKQWLIPGANGLRVVAERTVAGEDHAQGFVWDGEDINVLATRCMVLEGVMLRLPMLAAKGLLPPKVVH